VFDPRDFVLALPLIIWRNKQRIRHFLLEVAAFLAITNLPFFLQLYRILFRADTLKRNIASLMYEYDWIPLYSIAALTIIEKLSIIGKQTRFRLNSPLIRKTKTLENP
jgi:hypothetical protein